MPTLRRRQLLTDHVAARLCPSWWFEEAAAGDAGWEVRFALLLALLEPPGRRRAG